jgi:hypothetical protein
MSATTTTNTSLRPAIPKRVGQRGRHWAGKRAMIVDGSLQVDDTSRGQLKTSPSFSPAYLLAALEWAEDSENRKGEGDIDRPSNKPSNKPNRGPGGKSGEPRERKPLAHVPSSAHKTASNLKLRPGRRDDDVKKLAKIRPRPSTPRSIDLLPVFPRSRKTPVSFLPTPSSVSQSPDAAGKPVFFNKFPSPSRPPSSSTPVSPGSPLQNRKQHHHHRYQQRPGTSNEVGRPPWYDGPKEASLSADNVAQLAAETDRIILARPPPPGGERSDGKPAVYQTMQPSAVPPPSMTKSSSPPRQPQGPVREAFAFLSRGRKKSHTSSDSPRSTLTKRSRTLPISPTSTSAETQETQIASTDSPQSPGVGSVPDMARFPAAGENPTGKVSGSGAACPCPFVSGCEITNMTSVCRSALQRHYRNRSGYKRDLCS